MHSSTVAAGLLTVAALATACSAPRSGDEDDQNVMSPVTSTGTIGAENASLRVGYARLDEPSEWNPTGGLLLLFTSRSPFACPMVDSHQLAPGEASVNVSIEFADVGATTGTFPIVGGRESIEELGNPVDLKGKAIGSAYRAPAVCPADLRGGTAFTSGSVTVTSTSGKVVGTLSGRLAGGEEIEIDFEVPLCSLDGISGKCEP